MKKNLSCVLSGKKIWKRKILLLMNRLAVVWLFVAVSVSAKAYSQTESISLNMKNASLVEVFQQITQKTGYDFLYNYDLILEKGKVNVGVSSVRLDRLLTDLLDEKNLEYEFRDRVVVVRSKTEASAGQQQTQIVREVLLRGKVIDSESKPLPGVSVYVQGMTVGVATDINGEYVFPLAVGKKYTILYSFVGFKTASFEILLKENTTHNVMLMPSEEILQDVVVIGYGNKEKRDLTTAVSSVSVEDLGKSAGPAANSFDNMLGGILKGVMVTQNSGTPGTPATINIRGITSPMLNSKAKSANEPLFVIDGVPFFNDKSYYMLNPLMSIAPDDIESIDVLKDAAATSIYGSRGANGVIIVKTKSGQRNHRMSVNAGYTLSVGNPVKKYDPLNTAQFLEVQEEMIRNTIDAGNGYAVSDWARFSQTGEFVGLNLDKYGKYDTNWEKELRNKNALTHQYNVALRGGSAMTNYSFSFNATDQDGLYINDHLDRYSARLSLDSDISLRFKGGASLNYTFSKYKSGMEDPTRAARFVTTRPDIPVFDENGEYYRINADAYSRTPGVLDPNPVAKQATSQYETKAFQFMGSSYLEYEVLKNLKLHGDINLSVFDNKFNNFSPKAALSDYSNSESQEPLESSLYTGTTKTFNTSVNFRADYRWETEVHQLNAMVGYGWDRTFMEYQSDGYKGFPDDYVLNDVQSAYEYDMGFKNSTKSNSGLNSVYARVGYTYNDKYLAEVNFRSDVSSKFGPGNKRGYFPSLSLGWRMSEENFMAGFDWVDQVKWRFSVGRTGSTNLSDFAYKQFFTRRSVDVYGGKPGVGLKKVLPNRDVKWEMTTEYNGGVDFAFWNNRLYGSIDAYYRFTDGALSPTPAPLETGFSDYTSNLVDVSNRGIEVEIGGDIIRSADWNWSSRFNISFNRNKLEKLNGAALDPMEIDYYQEGKPVGIIKGLVVERIYQQGDEEKIEEDVMKAMENDSWLIPSGPGDYKYKDMDGNGYIDDKDKVVIATPEPKYFGGFFNSVRWKNLNLSFMFQFSVGAKALQSNLWIAQAGTLEKSIEPELYRKTWTPERTDARYARLQVVDDYYNMGFGEYNIDRYVYKTSYLRLKNITLSYDLPKNWLKRVNMLNAQVFASISNLWTLTDWPGIDPEGMDSGAVGGSSSQDPYPLSKTFSVGVKVQF